VLTAYKLQACGLKVEGNNQDYNFRDAKEDDIQEISKEIILYKT
jgi:hypothetical protein